MKSAVLMSGHFRNFEKSLKEFKKILPDSDFYAFLLNHGNTVEDSKNPNSVDDLEKTVNKLSKKNKFYYSFIEDEDIDMNQYKICVQIFDHFEIEGRTKKQITEKWIRQLNDYKKSFEWMCRYGREYDVVYRIRPDLTIKEFDYELNCDIDKFNCFQQNSYTNQINDKFFYSNFENMKNFMTGIVESLKDDTIRSVSSSNFNVEQYIYRYLKYLNYDINLISKDKFFMRKISNNQELCAGFKK